MKYIIIVCFVLLVLCCGCLQTNTPKTISTPIPTPTPTPTPIPAPIIGTWEGTMSGGILFPTATYRITFYPNHQFQTTPLTSEGRSFSGRWYQCITNVQCLPTESMYKAGKQYTTDNFLVEFDVNMFGQSTKIQDIVLLKDNTLDYRGTQHKIS